MGWESLLAGAGRLFRSDRGSSSFGYPYNQHDFQHDFRGSSASDGSSSNPATNLRTRPEKLGGDAMFRSLPSYLPAFDGGNCFYDATAEGLMHLIEKGQYTREDGRTALLNAYNKHSGGSVIKTWNDFEALIKGDRSLNSFFSLSAGISRKELSAVLRQLACDLVETEEQAKKGETDNARKSNLKIFFLGYVEGRIGKVFGSSSSSLDVMTTFQKRWYFPSFHDVQ